MRGFLQCSFVRSSGGTVLERTQRPPSNVHSPRSEPLGRLREKSIFESSAEDSYARCVNHLLLFSGSTVS